MPQLLEAFGMTHILRPARFGGGGPVTRYIHTLDGDGSFPYYSLGSAWDGGSASWYVTAEIATAYGGAVQNIFSAGDYSLVIRLLTDGKLKVWINSSDVTSSAPTVNLRDGKLHKIKVSWDSGTGYVSFDIDDGDWVETINTALTYTTQQINYVGAFDSSNGPLIGQILFVDINGEHSYTFDSNSTATVADIIGSNDLTMNNFVSSDIVEYTWETDAAGGGEAGWLGPENVLDPTMDETSPPNYWLQTGQSVTGGKFVFGGTNNGYTGGEVATSNNYNNRVRIPPGVYRGQATFTGLSGGEAIGFRIGNQGGVAYYKTADGTYTELQTTTVLGGMSLLAKYANTTAEVDDFSVRSFIEAA